MSANKQMPTTRVGATLEAQVRRSEACRSSNDSRIWGEVPQKYIYGQAVFRFWPFSQLGTID